MDIKWIQHLTFPDINHFKFFHPQNNGTAPVSLKLKLWLYTLQLYLYCNSIYNGRRSISLKLMNITLYNRKFLHYKIASNFFIIWLGHGTFNTNSVLLTIGNEVMKLKKSVQITPIVWYAASKNFLLHNQWGWLSSTTYFVMW